MKNHCMLLMFMTMSAAHAIPPDELEQQRPTGPSTDEVDLLGVKETPLVGSKQPFSASIKNRSEYYLDRLELDCEITDEKGFRVFKSITFQSSPTFSIKPQWPPITSQELGIPPGAAAEVALYTDDNRWSRGQGKLRYNCRLTSVTGRK